MSYTLTDIKVPEFSWDFEQNTSTATRVVRLEPWSALDEAVADLAGGAISVGSLVQVTLPLKYPSKSYLWLLSVQAKPLFECVGDVGSDGIPTDPTGGELTLQYRSPRFQDTQREELALGEGFVTIEHNMSLEYVSEDTQGLFYDAQYSGGDPTVSSGFSTTIDGETYWYGGGPVPIDSKIGAQIAVGDLRITWHRVANPPWRAMNALQGMVNDRPFFDFAPEQVLFVGANERKQFNVDGTDVWQVTYQFNIRIPKFKHQDLDFFDWDLGGHGIPRGPNGEIWTYYEKWLPEQIVSGGWNHYPRKGTTGLANSPYWQKVYRIKGDVDEPQTEKDLLYVPGNFEYLFQSDQDSNPD